MICLNFRSLPMIYVTSMSQKTIQNSSIWWGWCTGGRHYLQRLELRNGTINLKIIVYIEIILTDSKHYRRQIRVNLTIYTVASERSRGIETYTVRKCKGNEYKYIRYSCYQIVCIYDKLRLLYWIAYVHAGIINFWTMVNVIVRLLYRCGFIYVL